MKTITQEQFDRCCELTAMSSLSLSTICDTIGCKYGAMRYYIDSSDEATAKYARAKEDQADFLAEQMIEIADDDSEDELYTKEVEDKKTGEIKLLTVENKEFTNRSKLRVDTRKWIASKLKPKKYGDKIDITSNGLSVTREISISLPGKVTEGSKVSTYLNTSKTNNNDNISH